MSLSQKESRNVAKKDRMKQLRAKKIQRKINDRIGCIKDDTKPIDVKEYCLGDKGKMDAECCYCKALGFKEEVKRTN